MYLVPSVFSSFLEGYYRVQIFNCNSFIKKNFRIGQLKFGDKK